jgi:hypothetical protein
MPSNLIVRLKRAQREGPAGSRFPAYIESYVYGPSLKLNSFNLSDDPVG